MKILVIIPTLGGGGAERLHIDLANHWAKNNNQVNFLVLQSTNSLADQLDPSINVQYLRRSRLIQSFCGIYFKFKEDQPDIILSAMWPVTVISCLAWLLNFCRGKLFLVEHSAFTNENIIQTYKSNRIIVSCSICLIHPLASKVISVSSGVQDSLLRFLFLGKSKLVTIYNGININKPIFKISQKSFNDFNSCKSKIKLISIGRLSPEKDHITQLKALEILVKKHKFNIELSIFGEGPSFDFLNEFVQARKLSNNVYFHGFKKNLDDYLFESDLLIHSSKHEGFGIVLVEALALGVNVVAADCESGPYEILAGGKYGNLFKVGDHEDMSKAIIDRLKNPINPNILIQRAKIFSIERCSSQYLELFNS